MKPKCRHLRSLAIASSALLSISYAQAATWTWSNLANGTVVTNGNWSGGESWTGVPTGVPVSASTTTLSIGYTYGINSAAETTTLTNDVANPFQLNVLSLTGNSNAGSGSSNALINIAGSPLEFMSNAGTTPQVNLSSVRTNGQVITFNVQSDSVLTNNTLFTGNGTASFTFSGGISGASNLSKGGTSRLILSGTNSYTGTTTISGGMLQFAKQASLYNNNTVAGGWTASNIRVASGTLALSVGGTGEFTTANVTTILNNLGGANGSSSGGFAAGSAIGLVNAGAVTIADTITNTTGTGGGALGITKFGAGTLTLTGANTYTGTTSILQSSLTLAPTAGGMSLGAITATTGASPAYGIAAGNITLTLGGAGTNSITSITETSNAAQQLVLTKNTAATWTLGNVDVKQGNGHTVSSGILNLNGTFEWTSTNFDRRITVSSTGQLNYNNAGALKTSNGRLQMTGGSMDNTSSAAITTSTHNPGLELAGDWTFIGSNGADSNLNFGTGIVRITGTSGTNRTINVQNANTKLTLGGVISSFTAWNNGNALPNTPAANGLIKAGAGTLELKGANTYTGATAVNAGTLEVAVGGSTHASSAVTVSNAGTRLIVNGTVNGTLLANVSTTISGTGTVKGATTINGTLSPGASPGTMIYENTLTLAGTTLMEIDGTAGAGLTGGHDFVNLTGAGAAGILTFGGGMTIDIGTIFGTGNYSWNLFDMASETGTFATITLADQYSGSLLDPDFNGVWDLTSGNDTWQFTESTGILGLTVAVPEPNVAALIGGFGVLALLRRRR